MTTRLLIILLVTLFESVNNSGAATIYGPVPYRQRADSPFFQGILDGTIYVEDFEDGQLNTPDVAVRHGRPVGDEQGVDEDDGTLDGTGRNTVWVAPGAGLPEYGNSWSVEITFTPDPLHGYPAFAGLSLLGYSAFPPEIRSGSMFRAYDGGGNDVTGDVWIESVHLPPGTPYYTSLGDQFIGIYSSVGVSKILLTANRFDHLQYGWAIPEPATVALAAVAALAVAGRRRRIGG